MISKALDKFSPYPLFFPFIMSKKEKSIFDKAVKESRHYIEFGLGGSTIRALQKSKTIIYTVESSADWIKYMRAYLFVSFFEKKKRLTIFPVNIGPVRDWGYPASADFKDSFESYSSDIFRFIDSKLIDLVLVDGRFRVACTLKTILECHENKNMRILIHDFWSRPHYHVVLKYLSTVNRADTIGLFSIKEDVDLKSAEKDYAAYKFDPE